MYHKKIILLLLTIFFKMEEFNTYIEFPEEIAFTNFEHDEFQNSFDSSEILDNEIASTSTNSSSKKYRSWVWIHFTYNENIQKPQCNYCNQFIQSNKGSTTGMAKHLKNKHPLRIEKNNQQLTLEETIQNKLIPVSYIKYFI